MTGAAKRVVREDPRIALLRRLEDLPIVRVLQRQRWHVLCDAPMEAHFLAQGMPPDLLTQALEHGAFLSDSFALPCPPSTTVVVATRRSEEAVVGVLRTRGIKAVPLFAEMLPRMAAHAPLRLSEEALQDMPTPTYRLAVLAPPWTGAEILGREIGRLTGVEPGRYISSAQVVMAEMRAHSGFELQRWWKMLMRGNVREGAFATLMDWEPLSAFLDHLGAQERPWLEKRLSRLTFVRLRRDPLEIAAAEEAAAGAGLPNVQRATAVASILRRRDSLAAADAASDAWLQAVGAEVTDVDCADLWADPTGVARRVAKAAGMPVAPDVPDARPATPLRPQGQRYERFLEAARGAGGRDAGLA